MFAYWRTEWAVLLSERQLFAVYSHRFLGCCFSWEQGLEKIPIWHSDKTFRQFSACPCNWKIYGLTYRVVCGWVCLCVCMPAYSCSRMADYFNYNQHCSVFIPPLSLFQARPRQLKWLMHLLRLSTLPFHSLNLPADCSHPLQNPDRLNQLIRTYLHLFLCAPLNILCKYSKQKDIWILFLPSMHVNKTL